MTTARKSTAVALLCTAVLFYPTFFTVADAAAQPGAQTVEITFTKWFTRNADGYCRATDGRHGRRGPGHWDVRG